MLQSPMHRRLGPATSYSAGAVSSDQRRKSCDLREEHFPRLHTHEIAHAESENCAPANDRAPTRLPGKSRTVQSRSRKSLVGTSDQHLPTAANKHCCCHSRGKSLSRRDLPQQELL